MSEVQVRDERSPAQRDISDAAETCCVDILRNIQEADRVKQQSRPCTDQEKNKISMRKVIVKQILSAFLFGMIVWFIEVQISSNLDFGVLFNCDPNDERSIIRADDVQGNFVDEGVSYCYFKSVMIITSFVFLVPFLLESFSVVTIIWISTINDEVLIPISESHYAGYDYIFDNVMSPNPLYRILVSSWVLFQVPKFVIDVSRNMDSENKVSLTMIVFELLWKFLAFMAPDLLLTAALFPVSYFVMQASSSADEIIVNLVAVQVFAQLDVIFVKMLLRPRASVGESIQNYLNENPKALLAKYGPLEAYRLTINRHEWGVKVKGMQQMKELHEYDGFHFAP